MSRREALVTIGKAAAGVAAVAVAAATGLGYFYYEAQSAGSRTQSSSSASQSSSYASLASSATSAEPGFAPLFDGATLDGWQMAGPGGFSLVDGMLQSFGGMGLLWYTKKQFGDF